MKIWGIFRFEIAYQLRRPWIWLILLALLVVGFLMTRDALVADAMYEEYFVNGPFAIALTTVVVGILWLLAAPVVAGESAARDVKTRMYPLVWTTPVGKADYLGGRFLAALALNAFLLSAVQVGSLLAVYAPGGNPEVVGPFRPAAYLTAYGYIALANAFVATALQFSLALRTGRAMAGYLGSLFLVFMGFFVATLVHWFIKQGMGALLDPIGIHFIVEDLAHQLTPMERNTRLLRLEGFILRNRLLWCGVGLGALAITWLTFRFRHRAGGDGWWRWRRRRVVDSPTPADVGVTARAPVSVPRAHRRFGFSIQARKALAVARASFRTLVTSWAGLVLLVVVPLLSVLIVLDQASALGVPLIPATALVLRELTGGLSAELAAEPSRWVIVPLFVVLFAGELVWRERDAEVAEITDATPGSEWAPLLGKFLGLGLVLALFLAMLTAAGVFSQWIGGHRAFELGLYAKVLFGLQLPEYLLFAALALVVHVLVDQKYVGHLVAILVYAFIATLAGVVGIEHNLLVYGRGPEWSYTDIRGFGASVGPWLWFKLYWWAWAGVLAVGAALLWVRGKEDGIRARMREARRRFAGSTAAVGGAAAALVLLLGGFAFYNTNVRNEYLSSADVGERSAEYERRYRRYADLPQPRLTKADLRIDIHPDRGAVEIRGAYALVNAGGAPIDSIHVSTGRAHTDTGSMAFDRPATLALDDVEHGYRIYALGSPLEPGNALRLDFEVSVERTGFGNYGVAPFVVPNGTWFSNAAWFPSMGYQRSRELLAPAERREHGLEPRPVLASLSEEGPPAARGGGVEFEAVVSTDADQTAVAPGALLRTWSEGGRRWFHYATSAPIADTWEFFSADFAVREGRWNDVAIRIYHDPGHTAHLDGVMRSVQASLEYYGDRFGPYPYRHLTVVEHPVGLGTGAHADPSIVSHGQGFAFWVPGEDPRSLDLPFFVMAHEMAHQWTLPYALVEGLPFLAEGLATWFAMELVREFQGEARFQRLLQFMREPFPYKPIRHGEPLLRALDPYLSRRRGPMAMHALGEYVGRDRVHGAVRRLIERHDAPAAPLATTLDLYRELQAVTPDSLQYLLHDLFEMNAFWQLETERVTAEETEAGAWRVTLDVRARKVAYDAAGEETEVRMDEWIPLGVFGAAEPGAGELGAPLYAGMQRIRSGEQTITVTVPGKPLRAGVDPYLLLDWQEGGGDDNVAEVSFGKS